MYIPFFGPAYSRACELTADRIGAYVCGDMGAACRALTTLACGSRTLAPQLNLKAFKEQEALLTPAFAFLNDLWSTHPRITRRVLELEGASEQLKISRS
jgi:Zn-dependent protease with chaperone function